jgi:hypothetical protein
VSPKEPKRRWSLASRSAPILQRAVTVAATVVVVLPVAPACANAAAVDVSLRIEGSVGTLYEGSLRTDVHAVDGGDGTGPHPCGDGRPSVLGALADAATGRFLWRGTWNPDFQDFFVDRVGGDASDAATASFWSVLVNRRYSGGGCTTGLAAGDEVLLAYDTVNRPLILTLTGAARAAVGEPVAVAVRDGWVRADTGLDGGPVAGAEVGGVITDAEGRATLRFDTPGLKRLKAQRSDAIRSNALDVCVGDANCAGALSPAPTRGPAAVTIAKITSGERFARGRGPRLLRGTATGPVELSLKRVDRDGRCSSWDAATTQLLAEPCAAPSRSFATRTVDGRWDKGIPGTLAPGRYRLRATSDGRTARVRFSVAHSPRTLAATVRRARRYLIGAEVPGGGFGAYPNARTASLYTGWAALALAGRPTARGRPVLARGRAVLLSAPMRPRSLAELVRGALALDGSRRPATRRALRAWRAAISQRQRRDGSFARQVNLTAFAVLALGDARSQRRTIREARGWLAHHQLPDGGFPAGATGTVSDTDTTGAVLWALGDQGRHGTRGAAVRLLRARQNPDGGLGATAGAASNARSTALAILGFVNAGRDPRVRTEDGITPLDYLRARSRPDGSIVYARGDRRTPVWVTAQALTALADAR